MPEASQSMAPSEPKKLPALLPAKGLAETRLRW